MCGWRLGLRPWTIHHLPICLPANLMAERLRPRLSSLHATYKCEHYNVPPKRKSLPASREEMTWAWGRRLPHTGVRTHLSYLDTRQTSLIKSLKLTARGSIWRSMPWPLQGRPSFIAQSFDSRRSAYHAPTQAAWYLNYACSEMETAGTAAVCRADVCCILASSPTTSAASEAFFHVGSQGQW